MRSTPGTSFSLWLKAEAELPPGSTLFVFEGTRGGMTINQDEGDLAIDSIWVNAGDCGVLFSVNLFLFENWNYQILYFSETAQMTTTPIPTDTTPHPPGGGDILELPWHCSFDLPNGRSHFCDPTLVRDQTVEMQWVIHRGSTDTQGTGPIDGFETHSNQA